MSEKKQDQLIRETFDQYRTGIGSMPSQRAQIIYKLGEKPAANTRLYYRIAAVTAAGDTLALQIREFDLNAGADDAVKIPCYNLLAYINGVQVSRMESPVEVEMEYVLPEDFRDKALYAVFAAEDEAPDEILTAVKADYDEETGILSFETSQTGEFVIAAVEFDGEEFSPEFYDELKGTDEVKLFIKYLEEKKDDARL